MSNRESEAEANREECNERMEGDGPGKSVQQSGGWMDKGIERKKMREGNRE